MFILKEVIQISGSHLDENYLNEGQGLGEINKLVFIYNGCINLTNSTFSLILFHFIILYYSFYVLIFLIVEIQMLASLSSFLFIGRTVLLKVTN